MIIKFEEYIKEGIIHKIGVATGLSKPDDDIITKIIRIIRKQGVDERRYRVEWPDSKDSSWKPDKIYNYVIERTPEINKEIDPYGEEDWGENKRITIRIDEHRYTISKWESYYIFYVNNRHLDVSESNIRTLINILEKPGKIREEKREKEKARAKRTANNDLRREIF